MSSRPAWPGLAGALFVPVVGIISPALLGIVPSIEMVIWVALGGRTALAWAAAGAVIVNQAKTSISEGWPSGWLYVQGLLFVVVILFLPKGVGGAVQSIREYLGRRLSMRGGVPRIDRQPKPPKVTADRGAGDRRTPERGVVMTAKALLEIRNLVVAFDAFHAIDGLDLTLLEQEVRFVIGPNGAGKTTLIDSITNLVRPTSGSIMFAGEELVGRSEHAIVRSGIGRTFQKPSVFDELTVVENVDLAASLPAAVSLAAAAPQGRLRRGRRDPRVGQPRRAAGRPPPARSRTARSSGSRSRWCSSSARACCCSTSRSPA